MLSLFKNGFKGLSDTLFSGPEGSVYRSVGIDHRSKPGVLRAHQKLTKHSPDSPDANAVGELCKAAVRAPDGSKLWFSSESGKIWRETGNAYTKKIDLTALARDALFTSPEYTKLGVASSVVRFNDDGTIMYVSNYQAGQLRQYSLSTAYDPSTATLIFTKDISNIVSFYVRSNRLFVLSKTAVAVYRIVQWNISEAASLTSWSVSSQTTAAKDIDFKSDGTVMYVMDDVGDIHEYALSPAWGGNFPTFRMLLVAGGGGGGGTITHGSGDDGDHSYGGSGGAGAAVELFDEIIPAGVEQSVSPGSGGAGGAANTAGTVGGDTVAFGKTMKGGGYGGGVLDNSNSPTTYKGGDGGSGGGGARNDDDFQGTEGRVVDTNTYVGSGRTASGRYGGGANISSDISGSVVSYAQPNTTDAANNTAGANATGIGQGGQGGHTFDQNSVGRAGGNGAAGCVILRFKTADVDFSQTGGTETTDGDDTIITWTGSGTFEHTLTNPLTFTATRTFPTARGFAIESGRVVFIVGDTLTQYTMTGYDLTTASQHANVLPLDTDGETVTPRSVVLTTEYMFVGFETGADTDLRSVGRYEFVSSEVKILSATLFAPSITNAERRKKLYDSVGTTEVQASDSFIPDVGDETVSLPTNDILVKNSTTTAGYLRMINRDDPTQTVRGYLKTSTTVSITDELDLGQNPGTGESWQIGIDTVMADAMILSEAASDQHPYDGADTVIQYLIFNRDTQMDSLDMKFREGYGLNGGYDIILEIKDDGGSVVATDTVSIAEGDIGHAESMVPFSFTAFTAKAGVKYSVEVHVDDLASLNFQRLQNRYLVCPVKSKSVSPFNLGDSGEAVEVQMRIYDSTITESDEETVGENRIYFTIEKLLFYIKASDVAGSWQGKIVPVGKFKNGNTQHHPLVVQNLGLFIGDGNVLAKVDEDAVFAQESELNLSEDEVVQALETFDTDVLVGTQYGLGGRTVRWDTVSESWSAEDEVFEEGGVLAFIKDDNYVYVVAGNKGALYFNNGEKNELMTRIPEVGTGEVKVNPKAVGFLNLIPIFGLSNVSGNPVLQGIYGFGKYARGYPVSLSLDFPVPTGQFSGVEVGVILVEGPDLYASWKDGQGVGIAKLDYTAKYTGAYFETRALADSSIRHQLKTLADILIPYHSKPTNTGVTIGVKKVYEANYDSMTVVDDSKRMLQKLKEPTVPDMADLQFRVGLTVSGNDSIEILDTLYNIAGVGKK